MAYLARNRIIGRPLMVDASGARESRASALKNPVPVFLHEAWIEPVRCRRDRQPWVVTE